VAGFLGAHDADKPKFRIPLYFFPNNISQLHGQVKAQFQTCQTARRYRFFESFAVRREESQL
jgi:hypothetical protein